MQALPLHPSPIYRLMHRVMNPLLPSMLQSLTLHMMRMLHMEMRGCPLQRISADRGLMLIDSRSPSCRNTPRLARTTHSTTSCCHDSFPSVARNSTALASEDALGSWNQGLNSTNSETLGQVPSKVIARSSIERNAAGL